MTTTEEVWVWGWPEGFEPNEDEICEEAGADPCEHLPGFPGKVGLCEPCQRRFVRVIGTR